MFSAIAAPLGCIFRWSWTQEQTAWVALRRRSGRQPHGIWPAKTVLCVILSSLVGGCPNARGLHDLPASYDYGARFMARCCRVWTWLWPLLLLLKALRLLACRCLLITSSGLVTMLLKLLPRDRDVLTDKVHCRSRVSRCPRWCIPPDPGPASARYSMLRLLVLRSIARSLAEPWCWVIVPPTVDCLPPMPTHISSARAGIHAALFALRPRRRPQDVRTSTRRRQLCVAGSKLFPWRCCPH